MSGVHSIAGVPTSITAFVGRTPRGPANMPLTVVSFAQFERDFGGLDFDHPLGSAVQHFFANGGDTAVIVRLRVSEGTARVQDFIGSAADGSGLHALARADLFNLLCIPPDRRGGDTPKEVLQEALSLCVRRRAMLIVDPPAGWSDVDAITRNGQAGLGELGLAGEGARNAALYFPRVIAPDPLRGGQPDTFAPCGMVAGVIARTDRTRGVWNAPAGGDATLTGASGLQVALTDEHTGRLGPLGVNVLRGFAGRGIVVWGARTLRGAEAPGDEYKYIPLRRLALYLEESLYRGTQWTVTEPNDEPLWACVRLSVGSFMHALFRQGAFQGRAPNEAYFVRCGRDTISEQEIDNGNLNIVVGFAALKAAEFVVIEIGQMLGRSRSSGERSGASLLRRLGYGLARLRCRIRIWIAQARVR